MRDLEHSPKTFITKEYPTDWQEGSEHFYPVNVNVTIQNKISIKSYQTGKIMLFSGAEWVIISIMICMLCMKL